jgi:hypothetical protein
MTHIASNYLPAYAGYVVAAVGGVYNEGGTHASPASPLNRPSQLTSAVARPRLNPHSKRVGTASYAPLPAVSSVAGFQTPGAVGAGMFVPARAWKPSQKPAL